MKIAAIIELVAYNVNETRLTQAKAQINWTPIIMRKFERKCFGAVPMPLMRVAGINAE